ncbi:Caffeoylshikimate esterase [Vitis vinifera]|uniref:Caffeoylshikimate esterase n=1 Tax=Vitis vinifera TaxID=29760 RepID=A0A438JDW3_VITVI|nr:Caffeoylshikimate esterase [Vitis vinifera]
MELSMSSRFRSSELHLFCRALGTPLKVRPYHHLPIILRPKLKPTPIVSVPKTRVLITAKKRSSIEGVSEEMNAIASQSLDSASARRRVRSAFLDVQQQLDHCLFKIAPTGIRTEESCSGMKRIQGAWKFSANAGCLNREFERKAPCVSAMDMVTLALSSLKVSDSAHLLFIKIRSLWTLVQFPVDELVNLVPAEFGSSGIAKQIAASGYAVYALDYPGFGLSDGLHGYISSFDELVDDVIDHYTKIKGRPELRGLPHFILGQSMGGAVTLKAHLKEPSGWDGVILVAPMCKVIPSLHLLYLCCAKIAEDVTPPPAVLKVLTLLSKAMPKAKLFPQKDLAELAFRDSRKRKMVRSVSTLFDICALAWHCNGRRS